MDPDGKKNPLPFWGDDGSSPNMMHDFFAQPGENAVEKRNKPRTMQVTQQPTRIEI
jgi:hypothetical protein